MQELGQLLLIVTFLVTLATAVTAIIGATTKHPGWMRGARYGLLAAALFSVAMAALLTHGFLSHDFDNKYIAGYSERAMPTVYLLAAFWGGEKGALLFWVTSLAIFSNIAVWARARERAPVYMAWVTAILAVAILFFLVLMVFETSPFETWMTRAAPDNGQGLNPLLQNPVMAFHPPSLLTGYILFTIPFAFGMAALIANKLDNEWITDTRRWTLVSWTFLSIGLLLGCRWAYMEIGWGFWWMWDSVENAGLVPWFTATAFLHSVMIQERRGMLKRWNVILLALTFFLCIFGTFLTRSQLIVSIHAFADSKLPGYFAAYFIGIAIFSFLLIRMRWKALRSEAHLESLMSRESMFVLNNVVLVFCAFITLYGTLMGKITESTAVQGVFGLDEPLVWDEAKFNAFFVPIGIGLLAILGIGPLISWRRSSSRNFSKNFMLPLVVASLTTAALTTVGIFMNIAAQQRMFQLDFGDAYTYWTSQLEFSDYLAIVTYWLCAFVFVSMLREFWVAAKVRQKQGLGGVFPNLFVVLFKNPRRYGGYIVHIGIVFLFVAFTGKGFKHEEKDRLVAIGQTHVVKGWAMTLVDRDHRYSEADGCIINDATFVTMPVGFTVDEGALSRLDGWFQARKTGAYHVKTQRDTPKMTVHFKDPSERRRLLTDFFLARDFLPRFERDKGGGSGGLVQMWSYTDTKLFQSQMRAHAIDLMRATREAFLQSDLGIKAEIMGGSPTLSLSFADEAARAAFEARIASLDVPESVLVVLDEPEDGALSVVDRATGEIMVPESRFYPAKMTTTTEVSISQGDFLQDVYLSMQPDMGGRPYVKVFTVIFPLVNFLWIGGLFLLIGGVICLAPSWLGKTLAAMVAGRRDIPDIVVPMLFAVVIGGGLALGSSARAEADPLPEPMGFAAPAGDPVDDILKVLDCACPRANASQSVPLSDPSCTCPDGDRDRAVVGEIMREQSKEAQGSGRAKYDTFKRLIALDPEWETRVRYDADDLHEVMTTTRTVCPGEYLMTLDQSRATCTFRMRWVAEFRLLLAAGVSVDGAFHYYLADSNATMGRDKPWADHELRTFDNDTASFWVPAALLALVAGLIAVLLVQRVRRSKNKRAGEVVPQLSETDRQRLRDELEAFDA